MLLVGRHDASQGNWLIGYDPATGTLTYRSIDGCRIELPGVWFPYGQENINAAVNASEIRKKNKKLPPDQQIEGWPPGPVTWAIRDCGNAFQVKCMVSIPENPDTNTCYDDGCVAFDMNYDHLAVAELGAQGRLLKHYTVPIQMEGRTSDQITNGISEALEKVFKHAVRARKPVAMEDIKHLDKDLLYGNRKANRKISQFAYDKMTQLTESKGQKYGLAVRKSNPAYSSQIGKLKYMRPMGLQHEAPGPRQKAGPAPLVTVGQPVRLSEKSTCPQVLPQDRLPQIQHAGGPEEGGCRVNHKLHRNPEHSTRGWCPGDG